MRSTWPGLGTSASAIPKPGARAQHHAHLLQHVAVVVDPGLVEADRGVDAALFEGVERRDPAAQPEIRSAVVADTGPGRGDAVEIGLVGPHPVAQGQKRPEKAEAVDVIERGTPPPHSPLLPENSPADIVPVTTC
jgi:hypothetical protein